MDLIFNSAFIYFLYKCSFINSKQYKNDTLSTRITSETPALLSDFSKKKTLTINDGSKSVSTVLSIPYEHVPSLISNSYATSIYNTLPIENSIEYSVSEVLNNFSKLSKITYNLPSNIETKNATEVPATTALVMSSIFSNRNESSKSFDETSIYQLVSINSLTLSIIPTANTLVFPNSVATENSISLSKDFNFTKILFSNLPSSIAVSEKSVINTFTTISPVKSIISFPTITVSLVSTINSSSSILVSDKSVIHLSSTVASLEILVGSSEKVTSTPRLVSQSFSNLFPNESQVYSHTISNTFETSKIILSISASISSSITSSVIPPVIPPVISCEQSTQTFSNAITEMTQCIITHTNPMQVCLKCTKYYDMLQIYHKYLLNNCSWLVSHSNKKYHVITEILQAQDKTWQSLGCEKCYIPDLVARTVTPEFRKFLDLKYELESCFRNVSLKSQPDLASSVATSYTKFNNTLNVCNKCSAVSMSILKYYKYREDNNDDSDTLWCADINVAVAEIKKSWNTNYKCNSKVEKEFLTVISITTFFCVLPVIFYVGAKLHFDVNERKNANRYSQSE